MNIRQFYPKKSISLVISFLAASVLSACGGGGGTASTTTTTTSSTPVTFTSAAMAGELVTYTVDTTALTYSYSITESQYGLTGATGSGTLTAVGTNRYTLSGIPGATLVVLPNGLLLGYVRQNFGAGVTTVPVLGMSNAVNSLSNVAGTYNYVSRGCVSGSCGTSYGTIKVDAAGSWQYCAHGNLTNAAPVCVASGSGTLQSLGNGVFAAYDGGTLVANFIAMASGGQKVVLLDLKDPRTTAGSLGKGIVVASSQTALDTSLTNGSWIGYGTNGSYGTFNASGTTLTYTSLNGQAYSASQNVTADNPWTGMITTQTSGQALLAGLGVYVFENGNGYAEVGIKYQ